MKKLFYVMLLSLASSLAISACTTEEVNPVRPKAVGEGGSNDPM